MSKKNNLFLFVSLLLCTVVSFLLCLMSNAVARTFAAENSTYNTGESAYVEVDGTEFTFDNSGCKTVGTVNGGYAREDKMGGNDKPNKLYVGNFNRGVSTFLNFNGAIDSAKYNAIQIEWSKNINSKTTLYFYKNGDDPIVDTPVDVYNSGEGKYEDKTDSVTGARSEPRTTFFVNLYLPDFADEGTFVNGIIIKHQTDERETEFTGFQIRVYSVFLSNNEFADYSLNPDGEDFTVSAFNGYSQSKIGVSRETGKIYCNEFTKGNGITFNFTKSVNSSVYKTLALKISFFINGFTLDEYYLNIYRENDAYSVSVPVGGYVVKSTNDKSDKAVLEIEIPTVLLKSEGISVSSFSVTNNGSKGEMDSSALSLFVWGIDVLQRESQSAMVFPVSVEKCALEKIESETKLIFGFETFICKNQTEISDIETDCNIYGFVFVNGKTLNLSDITKITVGYKDDLKTVAISLKNNVLKNDGTDIVRFSAGEFIMKYNGFLRKNIVSSATVFRLSDPVGINETVLLSKACFVKSVKQMTSDDKVGVIVSFSEQLGYSDDSIKCGVKLNGRYLSELSDAVLISSEENRLTFYFDSSCFGDDINELAIDENQKIGNLFLSEGLSALRFGGDLLWYINSDKTLKVLWCEETDITDEYLTLKLKLSETTDEDTDISSSKFMQKISINGKSFYDVSKEGGLIAVLKGQFIDFKLKRSNITLYGHENDLITIEKGFTLPLGYKTDLTKQFKYSDLWQNYEVVPDISSVKDKIESTSIIGIQTSSDTRAGKLSLHIEFSLPISYRYYVGLQNEVCLLPDAFSGIASSNPSESYLSDLAFYGILDSCVKNIKFDGKTLEQWLYGYKIPGENWNNYIVVSYLGTNLSNPYSRRIALTFNLDDELTTLKKSHTIEFEQGFITPLLQTLNATYAFKWDPEYEKWTAFAENAYNEESGAGSGCSSVIDCGVVAVAAGFSLCAFAILFILRFNRRDKGGNRL